MSLSLVKTAIDARDWPTVLNAALTIWRDTRHPAVADVIDFASQKALEDRRLPVPGTNEAMQLAWVQASTTADAVTVGWLAAHLCERVPVDKYGRMNAADLETGKYRAWMDRLARLEALPDDPRIAEAAISALVSPGFVMVDPHDSPSLYVPLLRILKKTRDLRGLHRLRAELENLHGKPRIRELKLALLPRAIHMVEQASPLKLPQEDAWRALVSPHGAALTDVEQTLLAQVVAQVDDDQPRQVYADWLTERGDPRGEFISLQLLDARNKATKPQKERAAQLLQKHGAQWAGALNDVVKVSFHRGFPTSLGPRNEPTVPPQFLWELARNAPQLATVELHAWTFFPPELLASPHLVNAKSLRFGPHLPLESLRHSAIVRTLTTLDWPNLASFDEKDRRSLSTFNFPRLESLTVHDDAESVDALRGALRTMEWFRKVPLVNLYAMKPTSMVVAEFWPVSSVKTLVLVGRGQRIDWGPRGLELTCFSAAGIRDVSLLLKKPPLHVAKVSLSMRLFSPEHQAWMRGEALPAQAELQRLAVAAGADFDIIHEG